MLVISCERSSAASMTDVTTSLGGVVVGTGADLPPLGSVVVGVRPDLPSLGGVDGVTAPLVVLRVSQSEVEGLALFAFLVR
jgi:hypothetical protein